MPRRRVRLADFGKKVLVISIVRMLEALLGQWLFPLESTIGRSAKSAKLSK